MSATIPVLPLISIHDTSGFFRALGFEVTSEQTRPNVYLAMRRGDVHLHFMGIKKLRPEEAYSTCLVIVPDLAPLYGAFTTGLKASYGKVPVKGFPRITRWRPGQSRFTVVDVAGNSVIFIQQDARNDYDESVAEPVSASPLGKALRQARIFRDFKNDDAAAAKLLDIALRNNPAGSAIDRARVLAVRIELADVLEQPERAAVARAELAALSLTAEERTRYRESHLTQVP